MFIRSIICTLILFASVASAAPTEPLRRFALVIGSNSGAGEREQLRYAGHDASSVADVLQQLGGVNKPDLALLSEPDRKTLDAAFDAISQRVRDERKPGQRVELVVYYSGHADETGLLIGGGRYDYTKLRERIRAVPADVRIAIVDSCASGSFTRMKGGTKTAPFLRDSSNQVEGFAFLSSSSADEDAQESDKIGASFFTYFFVAALRGAADRNHDGKVTLTEAYQFAYEMTLGRTQSTLHGPQHPGFDMHLSGTGDVVITDLRTTESSLALTGSLHGHVVIVDSNGRVVVELSKQSGEALVLALPRDTYAVHVTNRSGELVANVELDHDGRTELQSDAFHHASPEETIARGVSVADDDDDDDDHHSPWYREIAASFGSGLRVERPQRPMGFDALLSFGGTAREVRGNPIVGIAETGNLSLGLTLGDNTHFAFDTSLGFGPGVFVGDNLQLGATVGVGYSGITGGVLGFGWTIPTELFAILELSPQIRPVAFFRQSYVLDNTMRKHGSTLAWWGDEAEAGAGLRFSGRLDGFFYGSVREMEGQRYWGLGIGAVF
jgi:hypothetical protein